MKRLLEIQQKLKAPKDLYNSYGEYKYRSAEGILEAVKPLLKETNTVLTISDDLIQLGDRYYVKAIATIYDAETGKEIHNCIAMAREAEIKKYALNGLFCIDDVKDPDATNKHDKEEPQNNELSLEKTVCPKCGKKTTKGALNSWGMCGYCYRASKKEGK